MEEKIK